MANNVVSLSGAKFKVQDISEQIQSAFDSGLSSLQINGPLILKKYAAGSGEGMLRLNHDEPVAYIEYSNDGGTSWQALGTGDGSGLEWDASESYVPGDVVLYSAGGNGGMYACAANTAAIPPAGSQAWRLLTSGTYVYYVATSAQLKSALEAPGNKAVVLLPGSFSTALSATATAPVTTIYSDEAVAISADVTITVSSGCAVYWHGVCSVAVQAGGTTLACTGAGSIKFGRVQASGGILSLSGSNVSYESVSENVYVSGGSQELWDTPVPDLYVARSLDDERSVSYSSALELYVYDGVQGGKLTAGALVSGLASQIPVNALSIGTVTTLNPGSDAYAEITGQAPAQTLSLGIPAGVASHTYVAWATDSDGSGFSVVPDADHTWRAEITVDHSITAADMASAFADAVWVRCIPEAQPAVLPDNLRVVPVGGQPGNVLTRVGQSDSYAWEPLENELPEGGSDGQVLKLENGAPVWGDVEQTIQYVVDGDVVLTIDADLDISSSNPVQNKAVYAAFQDKQDKLPACLPGQFIGASQTGWLTALPPDYGAAVTAGRSVVLVTGAPVPEVNGVYELDTPSNTGMDREWTNGAYRLKKAVGEVWCIASELQTLIYATSGPPAGDGITDPWLFAWQDVSVRPAIYEAINTVEAAAIAREADINSRVTTTWNNFQNYLAKPNYPAEGKVLTCHNEPGESGLGYEWRSITTALPSGGEPGYVLTRGDTSDSIAWAPVQAGSVSVYVDSALSDSSSRPVQNKVIKAALDNKLDRPQNAGSASQVLARTANGTEWTDVANVVTVSSDIVDALPGTNMKPGKLLTPSLCAGLEWITPDDPIRVVSNAPSATAANYGHVFFVPDERRFYYCDINNELESVDPVGCTLSLHPNTLISGGIDTELAKYNIASGTMVFYGSRSTNRWTACRYKCSNFYMGVHSYTSEETTYRNMVLTTMPPGSWPTDRPLSGTAPEVYVFGGDNHFLDNGEWLPFDASGNWYLNGDTGVSAALSLVIAPLFDRDIHTDTVWISGLDEIDTEYAVGWDSDTGYPIGHVQAGDRVVGYSRGEYASDKPRSYIWQGPDPYNTTPEAPLVYWHGSDSTTYVTADYVAGSAGEPELWRNIGWYTSSGGTPVSVTLTRKYYGYKYVVNDITPGGMHRYGHSTTLSYGDGYVAKSGDTIRAEIHSAGVYWGEAFLVVPSGAYVTIDNTLLVTDSVGFLVDDDDIPSTSNYYGDEPNTYLKSGMYKITIGGDMGNPNGNTFTRALLTYIGPLDYILPANG